MRDNYRTRVSRTGRFAVWGLLAVMFLCGLAPAAAAQQADPAGIALGDKTNAVDAGGNAFVVAEPTDKADPDYAAKKKAFDEYQAQAAKEPLAVKLADSVGHVRIATNFGWTLNTGYLVLFMQAGFALLTCGLVRKKNAAHLMMLNFAAYVFAFLAYYAVGYAFQFGAVAINAAPAGLGGTPTLNQLPHRQRPVGLPGRQGVLPERAGLRRRQQRPDAVPSRLHGNRRLHHRRLDLRADHVRGVPALRDLRRRAALSDLRLLGLGRRLDVAARRDDGPGSRLRGLRRLDGRARRRRVLRDGAGGRARSAPGQVRQGRQAARVPGAQHRVRRDRHVHPAVRMDGLQSRLDARRHRSADWRDRRSTPTSRRSPGAATAIILWYFMFGKPDISMGCNGMLAGLVAITAPCAFVGPNAAGDHRHHRRRHRLPRRAVQRARAQGGRPVRRRLRARLLRLVWRRRRWASSRTARTAPAGTASARPLISARPARASPDCSTATPRSSCCSSAAPRSARCTRSAFTFVVFKIVNAIQPMRVSKEVELEGLDVPEFGMLAYPGGRR